eukprot:313794_1
MAFMSTYPVRPGGITEDDIDIFFDFDKSYRGRFCKTINGAHEKNNGFIHYIKESGKAYLKCRDEKCSIYKHLVWKAHQIVDATEDELFDDELIPTTNDEYAQEFANLLGDVYMCLIDEGHNFLFFYHDGHIWKHDINEIKVKRAIMNEFQQSLLTSLATKYKKGTINKKTFNALKRSVKTTTGSDTGKNGILASLKLIITKDIQLDTNPNELVMQNGVYNVKTQIFRSSTQPNEYISNSLRCSDFDYIPKEKLDQTKYNEMEKILNHQVPHKDEQTASQQSTGSGLLGQVSCQALYNKSDNGHSGKSLRGMLSLSVLGESDYNYGMRASKSILTKNQSIPDDS